MEKLYFRYGAMGSGKSTALLQVIHNYEEQGFDTLLIKPSIDTKGDNKVVSRIGIERDADILIQPDQTFMEVLPQKKPWAIIVDEAQFLTVAQVDELYEITKVFDVPVICYGLRCDFAMRGFPGATRLLEIADDIEELKTICKCGTKATQNMRLINGYPVFEGEQIVIDDHTKVEYKSVCGKCYVLARKKSKGEL